MENVFQVHDPKIQSASKALKRLNGENEMKIIDIIRRKNKNCGCGKDPGNLWYSKGSIRS